MSDGGDATVSSAEATPRTGCIGLVDFGSTFTKVRTVTPDGRLVASMQTPTSLDIDFFEGLSQAQQSVEQSRPVIKFGRMLACSSAGGGLRMAVVGLERELTVEAARQAALSAGARIISVVSGGVVDRADAVELLEQRPDIVLLVGGTDGGDRATLRETAETLAAVGRSDVPVVVAGNRLVQMEAAATLRAGGWPAAVAPNVMPSIGTINPAGVREVVRRLFISHVIGGKLAGRGHRFAHLVQMATPDAVLRGTEMLSSILAEHGERAGVIVVDVGGATTDVHSALAVHLRPQGYKQRLLPQSASERSVEADLGVRWNASGVVEAAQSESLLDRDEAAELAPHAEARERQPTFLSDSAGELETDRRLATLAITIALRRHAGRRRLTLTPDGVVLEHAGRDLTDASVIIGTGGVFRSVTAADLESCVRFAQAGREQLLLPRRVRAGIDEHYVLAAVGLLAGEDERAARALVEHELLPAIATN